MTNRILLIYNAIAGRGQFLHYLPGVIDLFTKAGFAVEVYPTQAPGDAGRKIASLTEDYYMIVPAGGDGTLDDIVTAMVRSGKNIPLGYIPVGSTNDFAVSLGISFNPLEAAGGIIAGVPRKVDVGVFNENTFVYIAAFGAFTDVAYKTNQDMKNALGHIAYLIEATKRLGDLKPCRMSIRSEEFTGTRDYIFGMVSNSTSVGGMRITGNEVLLDDGVFEVTLVRNPKNILEMREIVGCLLTGNYDTVLIDYFKTGSIEFESDQEVSWTLDGEFGGLTKNVKIENRRRSVVMLLENSEAFLKPGEEYGD